MPVLDATPHMKAILLKKPYDVSFTGNPMPFVWNVNDYTGADDSRLITLVIRVKVEQVFNSDYFEEVYLQKLYPLNNGDILVDVSSILEPFLEFLTPRADLSVPVEAIAQRKRYKISYLLQNGDAAVGTMSFTPILTAVKGGMAKEAWHYNEFFTKIIQEQKKPLLFAAAKELTAPEAPQYLFWHTPDDAMAVQTVTYKVYFSDGTTASLVNPGTITSGAWAVNCVPSGFSQCGLDALVGDKSPIKYSVKITTPGGTVVEEYFFTLDNRNFYEPYFLLYRNSIGGMETVRLLGQVDIAADYARQQTQRSLPPSWYPFALFSQLNETSQETMDYTADTGFISKKAEMKLRDLFLSREKYMVSANRFIPIVVSSKKVKFFSNKDNLVSTSIEWQLAFSNAYFTPESVMPGSRTCPAVESFVIEQRSKDTLQVMWSLQQPYEDIEVQMVIDGDTFIYTYKGNVGKMIQPFTNPATDSPVTISAKARTICNPNSVPADMGPYFEITFDVRGNSLPVAVDDYFTISTGINEAFTLPLSLLDNDYDPDGDAIECKADWGLTDQAGVWTVDKEGIATYLPHYTTFIGEDSFEYQIHEIGSADYVTGRVHISVGASPVFAKAARRNVVQSGSGGAVVLTGDVYLEFYSDPSGTVPLDITGRNITIDVKGKLMRGATVLSDNTYHYAGTGTKVKIFSGTLYDNNLISGFDLTFVTLPGVGYTAI